VSRSQSEAFSISTLEESRWRLRQMRAVGVGSLIEHWDELNLLEVFQQIGAATP
jgi:hypothetical protein